MLCDKTFNLESKLSFPLSSPVYIFIFSLTNKKGKKEKRQLRFQATRHFIKTVERNTSMERFYCKLQQGIPPITIEGRELKMNIRLKQKK